MTRGHFICSIKTEEMKSKEKEYHIIKEKIIQQSEYWHAYMHVYV